MHKTSCFWTHVFGTDTKLFNALHEPIWPVADTCVPRLRTSEILQSSIQQGGRPHTAQWRRVVAGEIKKPPGTWSSRPRDKELNGNCPEQTGRHAGGDNDAKRLTCRRGARAAVQPLPVTRDPQTSCLSSASRAERQNHAWRSMPPAPSIDPETRCDSIPDAARQSRRERVVSRLEGVRDRSQSHPRD
jgi:hypothetical protein